jgi:hypothetical protein
MRLRIAATSFQAETFSAHFTTILSRFMTIQSRQTTIQSQFTAMKFPVFVGRLAVFNRQTRYFSTPQSEFKLLKYLGYF